MIWNIFSRMPSDANEKADYATDCYKGNFIAVGWNDLEDVGLIDRKELLKRFKRKYGASTRSAASGVASLWKFYHEVLPGHHVICPDKFSDRCYVGLILGKPFHDANTEQSDCPFANRRRVQWFGSVTYAQLRRKWGTRFAGNQTVSQIHRSSDDLDLLIRERHRVASSKQSVPFKPDPEWGRKAEERAGMVEINPQTATERRFEREQGVGYRMRRRPL